MLAYISRYIINKQNLPNFIINSKNFEKLIYGQNKLFEN